MSNEYLHPDTVSSGDTYTSNIVRAQADAGDEASKAVVARWERERAARTAHPPAPSAERRAQMRAENAKAEAEQTERTVQRIINAAFARAAAKEEERLMTARELGHRAAARMGWIPPTER